MKATEFWGQNLGLLPSRGAAGASKKPHEQMQHVLTKTPLIPGRRPTPSSKQTPWWRPSMEGVTVVSELTEHSFKESQM